MGEKDVHLHDASKILSSPHPLVPQSKGSILLFSRFDTYLYPQQIENKSKEKNQKHSSNYSVTTSTLVKRCILTRC